MLICFFPTISKNFIYNYLESVINSSSYSPCPTSVLAKAEELSLSVSIGASIKTSFLLKSFWLSLSKGTDEIAAFGSSLLKATNVIKLDIYSYNII